MPLTLANVTQAAVENEVSRQYSASSRSGASPRVVRIENWLAPDQDFVQAFPGYAAGGRAGRGRVGNEVEVTTEKLGAGKVAVYLVPNTQSPNMNIRNLPGTHRFKVGEAQL